MSSVTHWFRGVLEAFPETSVIWWTVVSGLLILAAILFVIGESLWGFGVRNFTAYTWFIRYSIPRPVLIGLAIGLAGLGVFVGIHFGFGKGWKTGPNLR